VMSTPYNVITVDPDEARHSPWLSLRQVSKAVDPHSAATRRMIEKLFECLNNWPQKGVGLSAPQVGLLARVFVVNIPAARRQAAEPAEVLPGTPPPPPLPPIRMAVINPTLTELSEDMEKAVEGCLSIPEVRGAVPRHTSLRLQGIDEHGQPIDLRVTGLVARVFQHEYDHLDGILYIDRMEPGDPLEAPRPTVAQAEPVLPDPTA